MYSRRSWTSFTYIIWVCSVNAGTLPSSLPGLRVPPLPPGPWQPKQPSSAARRSPRAAGLSSSVSTIARTLG